MNTNTDIALAFDAAALLAEIEAFEAAEIAELDALLSGVEYL